MEDFDLFKSIESLYTITKYNDEQQITNDQSAYDSDSTVSVMSIPQVNSRKPNGPFRYTSFHDRIIIAAVKKHGCKWRRISKEINMGSEDAIRNRVMRINRLCIPRSIRRKIRGHKDMDMIKKNFASAWKSTLKVTQAHKQTQTFKQEHRAYTKEEDEIILHELQLRGQPEGARHHSLWKDLAAGPLSKRTSHSIRNRAFRIFAKNERKCQNIRTSAILVDTNNTNKDI